MGSRGPGGARTGRFVPVLLFALWLLPPETRPLGQVLAAALAAAFVAVAWRRGGAGRSLWLGAAALAATTVWVHPAPALAVGPLSAWLLAGALGLAAADLGRRDPRALPLLRWTFVAGAAWTGLHALWQRAFGLERLARFVAERPDLPDATRLLQRIEEGRAFAAFATPAALGGFLALAVPVALGAALAARGRARLLGLAGAALGLVGLAASESFTGAAALAGGAGLVALVALRRGGARARRLGAATLALGLLLVASAVALRGRSCSTPRPSAGR